jgi:hypothetical protein
MLSHSCAPLWATVRFLTPFTESEKHCGQPKRSAYDRSPIRFELTKVTRKLVTLLDCGIPIKERIPDPKVVCRLPKQGSNLI